MDTLGGIKWKMNQQEGSPDVPTTEFQTRGQIFQTFYCFKDMLPFSPL